MTEVFDEISALYATWGSSTYDERVSQVEHAMQCAMLAQRSGADEHLVAAALLHDIGHLLELERSSGAVSPTRNDSHESTGAAFLGKHFGSAVTAPIALHVEAKRYLCTVEVGYFATLSEGSIRSLELQGGRMTPDELAWFRSHPAAERAVALRRWDEAGKSLSPSGVNFSDFGDIVSRAIR